MKQEFFLILIAGLLILAYVLDAVVNPLYLKLVTPYHYFDPQILSKYTFTTTSIVIKSVALMIASIWFLSFLSFNKLIKGAILLVLSGLMQLYALQEVATNARVVPLEWTLSLTLTGVALLIPAVLYIIMGVFKKAFGGFSPYDMADDFELTEEKKEAE